MKIEKKKKTNVMYFLGFDAFHGLHYDHYYCY